MHKSSAKYCLHWIFFSWCPLLLSWVLKNKISRWDLQKISLIILLKRYWLKMVLDIDFMTLNILKDFFSFIFLEFVMNLRAPPGGCSVLNMYESTWVHRRGFDLDLAVLRIHTINTFRTEKIFTYTYIKHIFKTE